MKEADNLPRDKEWSYLIDWSNPDSAKVLRDNGLLEDEDLCCWHCGKGEFQALPESMLINGYCNDCRIELGYTQYLEELVEKGKR